jgi:hypothetical protein
MDATAADSHFLQEDFFGVCWCVGDLSPAIGICAFDCSRNKLFGDMGRRETSALQPELLRNLPASIRCCS